MSNLRNEIRSIVQAIIMSPNLDTEKAVSQILSLLDKEIQKARVELEKKLDKVYSDFENNTPPTTFNKSEQTWNDGFYQGELKALETVSKEVFNKSGEQLEKGGYSGKNKKSK